MLDYSILPLFLTAVFVLLITPGPDMAFIIATGIAQGRKPAFFAGLGITSAMFMHGIAAAVGISALVSAFPIAFDIIRYTGATYLVWLAIKNFRDSQHINHPQNTIISLRENFQRGFWTNILNPKALLFEAVFLPQFANPALGAIGWQIFILGTIIALCGFIWNSILAGTMGSIARFLIRNHRVQSFQKWLLSMVYVGLAIRLLATERPR